MFLGCFCISEEHIISPSMSVRLSVIHICQLPPWNLAIPRGSPRGLHSKGPQLGLPPLFSFAPAVLLPPGLCLLGLPHFGVLPTGLAPLSFAPWALSSPSWKSLGFYHLRLDCPALETMGQPPRGLATHGTRLPAGTTPPGDTPR